jgi:outer membrane protein assembly factor BamA
MQRRILSLIIFLVLTATAWPQEPEPKPTVESVEITGVGDSRITREMRDFAQELVGQPFDQLAADEVGFQLQTDLRERISAIRQSPGADSSHIKLVFEFGGPLRDPEHESNVNSRYTVEEVELQGFPESSISRQLRDDMHSLVGQRLDESRADDILGRLKNELRRDYVVSRRVVKGLSRDRVRLIFDVERAPLLAFDPKASYFLAHSRQNFSFALDIDNEIHRVNRIHFGIGNDGDALLERYAGYWITLENIKAGTEHLGFRFQYFNFHDKWKRATEDAVNLSPQIPGIYRERRGVEPSIAIAFDSHLRLDLGASVTEMQMQYPQIHYLNANAGTAKLSFDGDWRDVGSNDHRLTASYAVRASTHNLDSDFIYSRHQGELSYIFRTRHTEFQAAGMGGVLTGTAPLFERFSLGNTSTLRGWNKYDLAPAGGNRMAHGSLEFRLAEFQVFYDVGSVWDKGSVRETAHSAGIGVHSRSNDDDQWFATLALPIRSGRVQPLKPVFMLGVRF